MPVRLRRRVLLGVGAALLAGVAVTAALVVWDVRAVFLPDGGIRSPDGTAGESWIDEEHVVRLEFTRGQWCRIQASLAAAGFDAGPVDGNFGPRTLEAILEWQAARNTEATGYLTERQARALMGDDSAGEPCPEALSGP